MAKANQAGQGKRRAQDAARRGRPFFSIAVLLTLATGGIGLLTDQGGDSGYRFSRTEDTQVQIRELEDYVTGSALARRVVQVDLAAFPKVSQFRDIDSSPSAYGRNACGLVAAATALGGDDWPELLAGIAKAAGQAYSPRAGIQPSPYADALGQVFGGRAVRVRDRGSLGEIYRALARGDAIIVDLKVSDGRGPSDQPPTLAHFARVLGMDLDSREIFVANTLEGPAYWALPLTDFLEAWKQPETGASIILDPEGAEAVDRWAVFIVRSAWPRR